LVAASAAAQPGPRPPTPNDTLVSPEVLPDRRVVFRIYAPGAERVTVTGDWLDAPGPHALVKDGTGVWATTVGPLAPDFYSYSYFVDEVRTADPRNPVIKQGIVFVENMFSVPGEAAAFQANASVPHGEIRQAWYQSSTLGMQRRLHVYTPPGYDGTSGKVPVLYLLHGGGDDDSGWSTIGRAGFILDNLIASKQAVPMVIVMPNGSLPRPAHLPASVPGAPPDPKVMALMQQRFEHELMKDVVPFVEGRYRVRTDREGRAIAGLSMGGGHTTRVITQHPDAFSYVGIWSMGIRPDGVAEFESTAEGFLSKAEEVNRGIRDFRVAVGEKDFALPWTKTLSEVLNRHGIRHDLHISGGGHTWLNWRVYLRDFATRLFKPS
jgi:enterochelin esterase family protein